MSSPPDLAAAPREVTRHPEPLPVTELLAVATDNLMIARTAETDDEMAARALVSLAASHQAKAQASLAHLELVQRSEAHQQTIVELQRTLHGQLAAGNDQARELHDQAMRRLQPPTGVVLELRETINELLLEHQIENKDGLLEDLLEAFGIELPPAPLELTTDPERRAQPRAADPIADTLADLPATTPRVTP